MRPVDADVVFATKHRDGEVDRLGGLGIAALLHLGLAVLDAPACIVIVDALRASPSAPAGPWLACPASARGSAHP